MKVWFLSLLVLCFVCGGLTEDSKTYKVIKPTRVDQFIASEDVLVLFCQRGYGDCDFALNLLDKFGKSLSQFNIEGDLKTGYVESKDFVLIAQKYGSTRGLEFVYFQHGKVHNSVPFEKMKSIYQLAAWVENSSKDRLSEFESLEEFEKEVKHCSGEYSTIVYFSSTENKELDKQLLNIHLQYDSIFQVKAMRNPSLISQAGEQEGTVKVFQCYDNRLNKEFTRTIDDDLDKLVDWALHRGTPLVTKLNQETLNRAVRLFDMCIVAAIPEGQEERMVSMLTNVAKKQTIGVTWDYSNVLKSRMEDSGSSGDVFPTAIAIQSLDTVPIPWNENLPFNEENLITWVDKLRAGTAEPFRKSEPIPPKSNDAVKKLVYNNFVDTISSGKEDVVVLFYGRFERCPECYTAQYSFKQVAESSNFPVTFYEYNVVHNYLTQAVSRLPEVFLYQKNGDIIRYPDEPYTKKHFTQWLKKYYSVHDEL